jgi:hypothetical protein
MNFELTTYKIDQISQLGQNTKNSPVLENVTLSFPPNIELSEYNFGVKIDTNNFQPEFFSGDTIIFSKKESKSALQNIYLFITDDNKTIIGEIIHKPDAKFNISSELNKSGPTEYRIARRKSFMTPTPLHIPTSQISPVADSSHERILICPVGDKKQLVSVPPQKIIYKFPMVFIHKNTSHKTIE